MLILLARKPLPKEDSIAANALTYGVGAMNIDASRISAGVDYSMEPSVRYAASSMPHMGGHQTRPYVTRAISEGKPVKTTVPSSLGRWPANLLLVSAPAVLAEFPETSASPKTSHQYTRRRDNAGYTMPNDSNRFRQGAACEVIGYADDGSASRFFKQVPP